MFIERFINRCAIDIYVSENFDFGKFLPGSKPPIGEKVWLNSAFRVSLIKSGIEKAGSINQLGREMGYRSKVHPGWSVRQILVGKQPFPLDRLKMLAAYLDIKIEEILKHRAPPTAITTENTRRAIKQSGMTVLPTSIRLNIQCAFLRTEDRSTN